MCMFTYSCNNIMLRARVAMNNAYIKRKGCFAHVTGGALTNYNNYVLPTLQKLGVCTLHHGHNVQCRGFSTHTHALIIIAISLFMIIIKLFCTQLNPEMLTFH